MSYTHEIYSLENTTEKSYQEFLADLFGMQWDEENAVASYGTLLDKDRCGININSDSQPKIVLTYAGTSSASSHGVTVLSTYKYLHVFTTKNCKIYGFGTTENAVSKFAFVKVKIFDVSNVSGVKDAIILFTNTNNLYIVGENNSLSSGVNSIVFGTSHTAADGGNIVLVPFYHIKDGTAQKIEGVYSVITSNLTASPVRNIFTLNDKKYLAIKEYSNAQLLVFDL